MSTDANEIITCPYNIAHQIQKYRMQYHLEKCRKQYPNGNTAICPFDASHVYNDVECDFHVKNCPKREMLDTKLYVVDDTEDYEPTAAPAPVVESEENWDGEMTTTYVPDAAYNNKPQPIIRKVKGATPAERRKGRMEGVQQYNQNTK